LTYKDETKIEYLSNKPFRVRLAKTDGAELDYLIWSGAICNVLTL